MESICFDLEALSITLPSVTEEHPNRVPFLGVLTRIDEPSTRPPGGSKGHLVYIPTDVARTALPSLIGMPVNAQVSGKNFLKGHNQKTIVGVITGADLAGHDLCIEGYLYGKNLADEVKTIQDSKDRLGFSYEISNVEVENPDADVWVLRHFLFTGAAVLEKNAAAYAKTSIAAQANEDAIMAETVLLDVVREIDAKVDAIRASQEAENEEEAAKKHADEAKCHDDEAEAAKISAARARDDHDDEDAARHDEAAKSAMAKAMAKRSAAMSYHASMAAKKKEAGDQDAAKMHEEEAQKLEAANAKCREDVAAMAAAAKKKEKGDDDDDDIVSRIVGALVKAMSYSPGMAASKEHPDEEQDKRLIKRLLKQEHGEQDAQSTGDLKTRRELRELRASVELLTDTVKKMANLITDGTQMRAGLATDRQGGNNGGQAPTRKTMQATGQEDFLGKYDHAVKQGKKDGQLTVAELNAQMDKEGIVDPRTRMARALEAQWAGILVQD